MLVILGQNAAADDVAIIAGFIGVDVDHVQDPRGARFDIDTPGLVKLVGKDILIVSQRDNKLHHQLTAARDDSPAGAPIAMLPANAIVLLMQTDGVGPLRCTTVSLSC